MLLGFKDYWWQHDGKIENLPSKVNIIAMAQLTENPVIIVLEI